MVIMLPSGAPLTGLPITRVANVPKEGEVIGTLDEVFALFSKFLDEDSDGKTITLRKMDMWFAQAKILDRSTFSPTDTGVAFNKFKSSKITYPQFVKLINDLATKNVLTVSEIKEKLVTCGLPGGTGVVKAKPLVLDTLLST